MADDDDCWDAFGSDSDDDDDVQNDDNDDGHQGGSGDGVGNINPVEGQQPHRSSAEESKAASSIAMHLSQSFVKRNPQVRLSDRIVLVVCATSTADDDDDDDSCSNNNDNSGDTKCAISKHLEQRGMRVVRQTTEMQQQQHGTILADALIVLEDANINSIGTTTSRSTTSAWKHDLVRSSLCPGGVLIFSRPLCAVTSSIKDGITSSSCIENHHYQDENEILDFFAKGSAEEKLLAADATILHATRETRWIARRKRKIRAHSSTCPWLSSSHSITNEEERLDLATVALSSHEMAASLSSSSPTSHPTERPVVRSQGLLTEHSIEKAVRNMKNHGYCVLPGLLDTNECLEWGSAVLDSFHEASEILRKRDGVDIYNPQSSKSEPQSYRELSMREDLRLDLRQGPALSRLRAKKEGSAEVGGKPVTLTALEDRIGDGLFLRGHPSLMEIIRRTMNPREENSSNNNIRSSSSSNKNNKNPLYLGNIGRWNFGGRGNDGSYQDLRVSPVGGIVSLPGSAEQALHADTPHLFEHIPDLPAHYINLFAPCTAFDEAVGGTAFVHGSHDLAFTAERSSSNPGSDDNASFYPWLVRPQLSLGDVVLFDCRILHFGLANTSKTVERCICYANTWQDWFHDAKNWDQHRAIFETE